MPGSGLGPCPTSSWWIGYAQPSSWSGRPQGLRKSAGLVRWLRCAPHVGGGCPLTPPGLLRGLRCAFPGFCIPDPRLPAPELPHPGVPVRGGIGPPPGSSGAAGAPLRRSALRSPADHASFGARLVPRERAALLRGRPRLRLGRSLCARSKRPPSDHWQQGSAAPRPWPAP